MPGDRNLDRYIGIRYSSEDTRQGLERGRANEEREQEEKEETKTRKKGAWIG